MTGRVVCLDVYRTHYVVRSKISKEILEEVRPQGATVAKSAHLPDQSLLMIGCAYQVQMGITDWEFWVEGDLAGHW